MYVMKTRGDIEYWTRERIELALLGVELIERVVWLALSVGLAVVAAICALRGSPWRYPPARGSRLWAFACCCNDAPASAIAARVSSASVSPRSLLASDPAAPTACGCASAT